jgi:hypothetical protein
VPSAQGSYFCFVEPAFKMLNGSDMSIQLELLRDLNEFDGRIPVTETI